MIIYIKKYTFIILISLVFDIMYINNGITKEGEQCKFIEWTWAGSYKLCWFQCGDDKVPKPINSSETCDKLISIIDNKK